MTRRRTTLALALALTLAWIGLPAAQGAGQNDRQFQAALQKEMVTGDLKGALDLYRQIAARAGVDRRLAAEALLHEAQCYQKLGDAQARAIYEHIVRDYADQEDAVLLARTRLGQTDTPGSHARVSLRTFGEHSLQSISGDGRYLLDGPNIRDVSTGTMVQWLSRSAGEGPGSGRVLSRDGTHIAYEWCTGFQTCELRAVSAGHGSVQTPRRLFGSTEIRLHPEDWSPDGRWIAVNGVGPDGTGQIDLVSAQTGERRILKSTDWRGSTGLFFSPDGHGLAFDLPVAETGDRRDVFVMAVDASREIAAVVSPFDDRVVGWSPDGRYLLFISDRSGTKDLWAMPFSKGMPNGNPTRLQPNLAIGRSLGVTKSGALYFVTHPDESDVEVRSIDVKTGRTGPATRPPEPFSGSNIEPAWSKDGQFLAFVSGRDHVDPGIVAVVSIKTGDVREVRPRPSLAWCVGLDWAPDGQSIACTGLDLKGRPGIFQIDVRTGAVSPVASPIPLDYQGPFWSHDGKRIYYRAGFKGPILERGIDSGNERVVLGENALLHQADQGNFGAFSLSPDGRFIGAYQNPTNDGPQSLVVVPVTGGQPREVLRLSDHVFDSTIPMTWTPDSNAVLVREMRSEDWTRPAAEISNGGEYWLVPVESGAPKRIGGDFSQAVTGQLGKMRLSPDGTQLAYVAGKAYRNETWVLENFLPVQDASK
jgi:Tol biopolymer transport system component